LQSVEVGVKVASEGVRIQRNEGGNRREVHSRVTLQICALGHEVPGVEAHKDMILTILVLQRIFPDAGGLRMTLDPGVIVLFDGLDETVSPDHALTLRLQKLGDNHTL